MKVILLLALCIAVAIAATPTRPTPPESYEARVKFDIENRTAHIHADGDGLIARNYTGNTEVRHAFFDEHPQPFIIYQLARFDLGTQYTLDNHNWTQCHNETLTGHLPQEWGWLANATYFNSTQAKPYPRLSQLSLPFSLPAARRPRVLLVPTAPPVPALDPPPRRRPFFSIAAASAVAAAADGQREDCGWTTSGRRLEVYKSMRSRARPPRAWAST